MLTIVIPTIKYSPYLDLAIKSAYTLQNKCEDIHIHINMNSLSDEYKKSPFWEDKNIVWRRVDEVFDKMYDSLNDAIKHAKGERFLILSDDDMVKDNLLDNVQLDNLGEFDLFANRVEYIDEFGTPCGKVEPKKVYRQYSSWDCLSLIFNGDFYNHLSSFIFSRTLFDQVGGFKNPGYPNCFYVDEIFHCKIVALAKSVYFNKDVNFSRRESSFQASANFYFDAKDVNLYFEKIINEMFVCEKLKSYLLFRFKTKERLKNKLMEKRFFIELKKLDNELLGERPSRFFLYKKSIFWDSSASFKCLSLFYVLIWPLNKIVSHKGKLFIKRKLFS